MGWGVIATEKVFSALIPMSIIENNSHNAAGCNSVRRIAVADTGRLPTPSPVGYRGPIAVIASRTLGCVAIGQSPTIHDRDKVPQGDREGVPSR